MLPIVDKPLVQYAVKESMDAGMIDVLNDDMKSIVKAMIPANKFGPTDDILSALLYLSDEKSSYVTGQTIHINGGMFMNS